ncbi:suppressor of fused domain protein [Glycomyces buryatensis]|uniref:Suppressor of fused domain protein n=1 Tax=Glycomyces buryatensis TaxID=2570927 RepID=A0A4V4HST5_9ACTN|nr:suppressor of fused domain protein [Glycomyces buryatensis]THV42966.1 suppressor of fused domain protein [Glycomyces buryatensis]
MALNESMRQVADRAAALFGRGDPPSDIKRLTAPDNNNFIDIAVFENSPSAGLTAYTTMGLSAAPMMNDGREFPARIEICGAADSRFDRFGNAIATCGLDVLGGEFVYPNRILVDVVATYYPDVAVRHVLFVEQAFWDPALTKLDSSGRTIIWLQAVPVTDAEVAYARSNGSAALVDLLTERDAKPSDLLRESVV